MIMATVTKRIGPHRRLGLSSTPTIQAAQAASLSAVKGAPVQITSGYINVCDTASVSSSSQVKPHASGDLILGFLQEDGAGSASNTSKVGVIPAFNGMMFKGQLMDSSGAALVTLAQTHLGTSVGLGVLSGDTHYAVDASPAASADCLTIVELIDPIGTVGGQVGFIVKALWRELDVEI
jgi:hypothetical protein